MNETEECSKTHSCSGYGTCITHYPGTHLEFLECLCDLWHTGQNCELLIPFPFISSSISALMLLGALFFCWQSARRFRTKETYVTDDAWRFVDYMRQDHIREKEYLDAMHKQEDQDIRGKNCKVHVVFEKKVEPVRIASDEKYEIEPKSDVKPSAESTKVVDKSVSVAAKRPAATPSPIAASAIDESARVGATGTTKTLKTLDLSLARKPSDQLVPSDAPDDNRKAAKERRQANREIDAELKKMVEKSKKSKKTKKKELSLHA